MTTTSVVFSVFCWPNIDWQNIKRRWLVVTSGLFYLVGTALMFWLLIDKSIDVFRA